MAQLKFIERRRLVEASLSDLSTFAAEKGYYGYIDLWKDIITLYRRREYRRAIIRHPRREPSIKTADDLIILPKSEPEEKRNVPIKYEGFQCLFCRASVDLPLEDRKQSYATKHSLQRYTDRCHLNKYYNDF